MMGLRYVVSEMVWPVNASSRAGDTWCRVEGMRLLDYGSRGCGSSLVRVCSMCDDPMIQCARGL